MKNQFLNTRIFLMLVAISMILTFALSLPAQKRGGLKLPPLAEDTSINPHDFNDDYYAQNGVSAKSIIARRNGYDMLSVIGLSNNPFHRSVRVTATFPAYGVNGEIIYWSLLGELNTDGFTDDGLGIEAREMANTYPLYVFPRAAGRDENFSFTNNRQAAIIDETQNNYYSKGNPLGLRTIILVNFTEKAFNTKEGIEMMGYMTKKNGRALDGTPIIKHVEDINYLFEKEFISLQKRNLRDDPTLGGSYVIGPVIYEPIKFRIAMDAFLFSVMQNGQPLPAENEFVRQFGCLQKTGEWCGK